MSRLQNEKQHRMMEQEKVGKARIIGYGIGLAVFIVVVVWNFLIK
ncbi:MAG TPA: hypothetical protein VHW72_08705 [Candidatus Angelobacter sp.]|jgi:hypothetical protein|nr:hypothetical protein [Candidatus Angelobacter sp.]